MRVLADETSKLLDILSAEKEEKRLMLPSQKNGTHAISFNDLEGFFDKNPYENRL